VGDEFSVRVVDAINAVAGAHDGFRAAHAKGVCCRGTFTPTPAAAGLSRAAHFAGPAVAVTVRFSNGSGDPTVHDAERDGRGMAVKFHLPDGSSTDIVALTLPVFFVRTPEAFLAFTEARARQPDTGEVDMERVGAFLAQHPEAQTAIGFALGTPPPASYAQCVYHGIHAFRLLDAAGGDRYVRYHWHPEAGEATLDDADAQARPADYLAQELDERLASSPVVFTLVVELGSPGDATDDPTTEWPPGRERVTLGRLEIDTFAGGECDGMVFDPTNVVDGVECSDDAILAARGPAYSESYRRRRA
jgi:catalase